ncbi:MAG: InlB B-repeat-containing protein, partial [Prevotella sp.]|nr:InlB B-repeat-containing protein [Prevotella sp.]
EYWQCSVCGKCFSDEACTNEISEAEALIGVFGAIADGRYTLTSQTYTLTDDVNTAGYIYVPEGVTATIDLNGHTIDRGLTSADNNGSVIIVKGTLTIKDSGTDGKVQGGYDAGDGYGYYTSCVKVLEGATFNLQGGTLIGRDQDYDYTVSVVENSYFTMTGGKITGGKNGVAAYGNVVLSGGEISGNSQYGVDLHADNFSVSGNPVITNNTKAKVNILGSWLVINVVGALTDGANIGITAPTPTDNTPVTVTSGYGTYNSEPVSTYFSLDNDGQIQTSPFDYMTVVMGWNEDRTEIAVGTATRTVTFDLQGHGSNIEAVSLLNGYKLIEPTEPTAEGWSFGGWYTDAECTDGNAWDFTSGVTSDMTLYALWTQGQTYRVTLPENMVIVSADNEAVGGKYPTGTNIRFKVKSADYVVDGDVKNGDDVLTADDDGIYTVTVGEADITITATVKKAVEANKELSGSESYTAQTGDVMTGSTSGTVTIPSGASITLSDVAIGGGIVCNGTATITLVGENSVSGATNKAGIQIGGSSTTLTIKGNGSLTANGGSQSAGIGLSRAWEVDATGGDIVIEGGNITATGDNFGAGIGTGVSYGNGTDNTATIGNITIKGGTVKAIGGTNQSYPGSGIGKGGAYSNGYAVVGTITIYDGIDMVDASSISESIVYMHETTDVTASKADYFTIIENSNRLIIVQKVIPTIADVPDQIYTGSAITPKPLVKTGSLSLTKGTDYEYSYTNNTNVGTAKVTVTFKGDYTSLGSVEKEFTITKATPTVTAPTAIADLVYTGSAHALVTGGTTDVGDILSYCLEENGIYSTDIPTGTNAGTYTVYYKVDGSDNWNAVAGGTVEVPISPKAVTVTAEAKSKEYGAADPDLTATVEGLVGEDAISYTVSRTAGEAVGEYTITPTGEAAQGNYTVSFVAGTLAITAKPVTVSGITVVGKTYDGTADATLDYSAATISGLVSGDNLTVTATGAFTDANAGEGKVVTISDIALGGTDAANYVLAESGQQASATASIAKATPEAVDFVFSAPTELSYDGSAKAATFTLVNPKTGVGSITSSYYKDGVKVDAPVAAGTYAVKIDVAEGDNFAATTTALENDRWTFTITGLDEGAPINIALTEEYGTYCSAYDLDFSGATGLTAYIAAGYNKTEHTLLMVKVTSVPKGTGLLLKSTSATGGNFTATVQPSPYVYSNLLTGTTAGTNVTADDFILGKKGDKVGFYHAEAGTGTLAPGKAYLDHTKLGTSTSGARMLNLEFYDDATAIRANIREIAGGDQWYTLDGRKLQSKPTLKGLYILNGKKTVVR